jgi:hypothetical protein
MRVMIKFRFPTVSGTDALRSGKIEKLLPQIMEDLKPEAMYFYPENGLRSGHLVVNMDSSTQVLEYAERLWIGLGGEVEMTPVMAPEDIMAGLGSMPGIMERYG